MGGFKIKRISVAFEGCPYSARTSTVTLSGMSLTFFFLGCKADFNVFWWCANSNKGLY